MSKRPQLNADGRPPVGSYSRKQLHQLLVEDAVKHHATDLQWATEAYLRIGLGTGTGAEQAIKDVLDDVEARTGFRLLPMASATSAEVRRMLQ